MSTPAAKRRRIDAATQALSKPFRSPFKTPLKSPSKDAATSQAPTQSSSNNVLASKTTNTLLPSSEQQHTGTPTFPRGSSLKPSTFHTPRPLTGKTKTFTSPISTAVLNADPDIAPLLRAQRELEKQLREVKEELDAAEQARKIEAESRRKGEEEIDGELVLLMGKWRAASQMAAEELFGKVRDRVNRMGGPRAWKEAQKKQQEYQSGWDQEDQNQANNNDDNDDDDEGNEEKKDVEKRDLYAEYGIDPETENEKSQRAKGVGDTGEMPGQEDEFTMAMMLRTLNVDLDIIGYDREGQRWVD